MSKAICVFLAILSAAIPLRAEPRAHIMVAVGEAPYQDYDMMSSGPLPQAGLGMEWATAWVIPYARAYAGFYNGLQAEGSLGLAVGHALSFVRPSLCAGIGAASVREKHYRGFEGGEEYFKRMTYFPLSVGARLDVVDRFFADLDFRNMGFPHWKFELGFRVH